MKACTLAGIYNGFMELLFLSWRNLSPDGNFVLQGAKMTTFVCSLVMLPKLNVFLFRVLVYPEFKKNVKDKLWNRHWEYLVSEFSFQHKRASVRRWNIFIGGLIPTWINRAHIKQGSQFSLSNVCGGVCSCLYLFSDKCISKNSLQYCIWR